jgi:hypothetical protein
MPADREYERSDNQPPLKRAPHGSLAT